MFESQVGRVAGIGPLNCLVPDVLALLDLFGVVMQVSLRVKIEVGDVVAKGL